MLAECSFIFYNHGKRASVLMGFPEKMCDEGDIGAIRNFKTVINNKDILTSRTEDKENLACEDCNITKSWYTWKLSINEKDSLEVRNYYSGNFGTNVCGSIFSYYTLGTGKTWYKDITEGSITFIHDEIASSLFRYIPEKDEYLVSGIRIEEYEDSVKFYFHDFEPECDLKIGIDLIGFAYKPYDNIVLCNYIKQMIHDMSYTTEKYRLMRNEIFARHGYVFSNPELNNYFKAKSWYAPKNDFNSSLLSIFEKELVNEIKIIETPPPKNDEKKNQNGQHILQQR
jgi:hypothetical protein